VFSAAAMAATSRQRVRLVVRCLQFMVLLKRMMGKTVKVEYYRCFGASLQAKVTEMC
jgi:hypothetical protein